MESLYKNNLLVLKDINENGSVYYIDNSILKMIDYLVDGEEEIIC